MAENSEKKKALVNTLYEEKYICVSLMILCFQVINEETLIKWIDKYIH